jgi:hypothetical protein
MKNVGELSTRLLGSREIHWARGAVRLGRKAGDGPRFAAGKNVRDKKNSLSFDVDVMCLIMINLVFC